MMNLKLMTTQFCEQKLESRMTGHTLLTIWWSKFIHIVVLFKIKTWNLTMQLLFLINISFRQLTRIMRMRKLSRMNWISCLKKSINLNSILMKLDNRLSKFNSIKIRLMRVLCIKNFPNIKLYRKAEVSYFMSLAILKNPKIKDRFSKEINKNQN